MTNSQANRGPDQQGIHVEGGYGVGITRLRVTDTGDSSAQPFVRDRRAIVCFNGQIYNFRELAIEYLGSDGSEAEVIAELIESKGVGALRELKGMYALAYFDTETRSLLLARSPFGQKPLYWRESRDEILFASTVGGIKAGSSERPALDDRIIAEYLIFRSVGGVKSAFRGIRTIPPGSWMWFSGEKVTAGRIWQAPTPRRAGPKPLDEISSTFSRALERRLAYDCPLAISVSGGFDSSLVACLAAARREREKLHIFSIGYEVEDTADERAFAEAIAGYARVAFTGITLRGSELPDLIDESALLLEDPNQDPVVAPTLALAKRIREYSKVTLTGDGADEVWGGYERFGRAVQSLDDYLALTQIFTPAELGLESFPASYNEGITMPGADLPPRDQVLRYEVSNRLRNYHLSRIDKIYAGSAVEARSPFLDVDFVDLGLSLPAAEKMPGGRAKSLLLEAFSGDVPSWLTERKKQPFSLPLAKLFAGELKDYAREVIADSKGIAHSYVDCRPVVALLEKPADQLSFVDTQKIWSLCFLNRWYDLWFRN